jgi:hypothetical protein
MEKQKHDKNWEIFPARDKKAREEVEKILSISNNENYVFISCNLVPTYQVIQFHAFKAF